MLTTKEAGDRLDELTRLYQSRNPKLNYAQALEAVMAAQVNADLVLAYCVRDIEVRQRQPRAADRDEGRHAEHASVRELGDRVDRLVREHMAANNVKDYAAALNAVLAAPANSELKVAYASARQLRRQS